MKKIYKLLIAFFLMYHFTNLIGQNLSGTYYIPSGKYKSLTCDSTGEEGSPGIFQAINNDTLSGNITIIIDDDLTNESGYIALKQWIETGAGGYTITIKPDGTTERLISTSGMLDLITLDGAKRVIIDGQYNNDGLKHLRFRNSTGYNSDFTFINGASNNTIKYCFLETNTDFPYSAAILFSTSTAETGNLDNTISYCDIKEITDATAIPYYGIYSEGSASPQENINNTISNCNIYNFSYAGIFISGTGNGDNWKIIDNSFYYNLSTPPLSDQRGIDFEPGITSNNNTISGNFIGGSAPNCGGNYWVNTGSIVFYGILINAGKLSATSVNNNKIQNISLTGTDSGFLGIDAENGSFVNITDNIIGHISNPNSITCGLGNMYGIYNASATANETYNINNNTVANIMSLSGGNLIGIGSLTGSPTTTVNIQGNNIYNISGSTSGTFNIFRGIDVGDSCKYNISNNSIHDLSTESVNGWNWGWGLTGIVLGSTTPGQTISKNSIYNLMNTDTAADGLNVYGIVYSGPADSSPVSTISSNHIYNLTASTSVSSGIYGIVIVSDNMGYGSFMGGCGDIVNNMISLGSDMNSYSHSIYGIYKSGDFINKIYYNTIYIGGTPNDGAGNTACYYNYANTNDILMNNIFYNSSSNTGNSIAVHNAFITSGASNLTFDYNDYIVTGIGGILSDMSDTLPIITGQDTNSIKAALEFVSATDLHLTTASVNDNIKGKGIDLSENIPLYIVDIDNDLRTEHPDLGADQHTACVTPVIYNVSGGGSYCSGDSGVNIGLSDSQAEVVYELLSKDNPTGNTITGTGNPVSFGYITSEGIYTVRTVTGGNFCNTLMNGTATVIITPVPSAPLAITSTGIGKTQFAANWESVTGAVDYYIDVAYDSDFTNFTTGFNNKSVGNVLSYTVTGLLPNTIYYYRVRAYNVCVSENSNTIDVTTLLDDGIISRYADEIICNIYSTGNHLSVNYNNPKAEQAILQIFNIAGKQVNEDIIIRNGNYNFPLELASGCYLAKIISSKQLYLKKIILN